MFLNGRKKLCGVNGYFKCLFEKNCLSVCLPDFFWKCRRTRLRSNDLVFSCIDSLFLSLFLSFFLLLSLFFLSLFFSWTMNIFIFNLFPFLIFPFFFSASPSYTSLTYYMASVWHNPFIPFNFDLVPECVTSSLSLPRFLFNVSILFFSLNYLGWSRARNSFFSLNGL